MISDPLDARGVLLSVKCQLVISYEKRQESSDFFSISELGFDLSSRTMDKGEW